MLHGKTLNAESICITNFRASKGSISFRLVNKSSSVFRKEFNGHHCRGDENNKRLFEIMKAPCPESNAEDNCLCPSWDMDSRYLCLSTKMINDAVMGKRKRSKSGFKFYGSKRLKRSENRN